MRKRVSSRRFVAGAVVAAATVAGVYAWATRPEGLLDSATTWAPASAPAAPAGGLAPDDIDGVRVAQAVRRASHGLDDPGVADLAHRLGDLCRAAGRFDEARAAYAETADVRTRWDGPAHWQVRECRAKAADLVDVPAQAARAYARRAEAERLLARGNYPDAHRAAAEALEAARAARGPDHADTAEALLLLGMVSTHHGDHYPAAERVLTEARTKLAAARGPDHPRSADCLHWLGTLADDRGEFDKAEELYAGAMKVHAAARGEMSAEYARSLSRSGRMGQKWWKDYAAGKLYRAQTIREELLGRAHPDYAESLEDLALFALAAPDFAKADRLLTEALAIRRVAQGPDHPEVAETASLLGLVRDSLGNLAQAQGYHRQAVRLTEQMRGPSHPLLARYLMNHTISLAGRMTEFPRVDRYGRRALEIWARLGLDRQPDYLETRFQIVWCRVNEMSRLVGWAPDTVADLDHQFQQIVDGYERLPGGRDLPGYALAVSERVHMHYYDEFQSRPAADVEQWLATAGEAVDRLGGRHHPGYFIYLNARGRYHLARGDYDRAGPLFRESLEVVRKRYGPSHPWFNMYALHAVTGMYLHKGDPDGSREFAREALRVRRDVFDRNSHAQSDGERISQVVDVHFTLSGYLSAFVNAGSAADCYDDVLRIRGAAAAQQVEDRAAHDHPNLGGKLDAVRTARRALAGLAFQRPDGADQAAWLDRLDQAADHKADLEIGLALDMQQRLPPPARVETAAVRAALPADAVLVDYLEYTHYRGPDNHRGRLQQEKRLAAFVVRPDRDPVFVPLGPAAAVEKAVTEWRVALADRGREPVADRAAAAVARLVWAPLQPHLGSASTVLVAPDGPVCFLSFAALPGRAPGTYLLEDYTLGYLPSGRAALDLGRPVADRGGRGLLAVGGIEYGGRPAGGNAVARLRGMSPAAAVWKDLPCTEAEAEGVADRFGRAYREEPVERLGSRTAGARQFARALDRHWRCVHFAGHGFFADPDTDVSLFAGRAGKDAPGRAAVHREWQVFGRNQLLLSGLVFARTDDPGDGLLTAEEVAGFDLRGTDLVVLSACETGLGGSAGGEGVLGLQRAFLGAGAGCMVTSLWKVNDAATSVLMDEFYANLLDKKLSKWEALRQAQLVVLRDLGRVRKRDAELSRGLKVGTTLDLPPADGPAGDRTRPSLWAAFVVSGDGR